jgi:hypothetical protein
MFRCSLCHFPTELNDVAARLGMSRCICLRCYARETGNAVPMPKGLRRELGRVLAVLEPSTKEESSCTRT